jgi:glycosyltransferase involved in cell wall biosynthesis
MKLWIINQYARTPDTPGLTRHYDLAKHLKKLDVETTIFHGSFDLYLGSTDLMKENHHTDQIIEKKTPDGVSFITFPTLPYHGNASFGRIKNMWKFSLDVCRKVTSQKFGTPDIILGSTMTLFAANAARKLARKFHVPFVYEVRDLWPLTPIELGGYSKWHPFLLYLDYLDRKLAKTADLIITTAPLMKEYYKERFGLPDEKFLWITNGTDVEMFQQTEKAQDMKDKTTFDIYYTGAHGLANGLDKILDQMHVIKEKFPQVRLVLVGDGPMKPRLQERAKQEELPVTFLDPMLKKELPKILSDADALLFHLLPSSIFRFGISPNKIADYHAAGKPILMVGEYAQNPVLESNAGLVARTTEELPHIIGELLELEPAERKAMGLKGIEYAKKNYDWASLAKTMYQKLEEIKH